MAKIDSTKCKTCIYRADSNLKALNGHCEYILFTGEMRGCPPGSECEKYKRGARLPKEQQIDYLKRNFYGKAYFKSNDFLGR